MGIAQNKEDPWEKSNRFFYKLNDNLDRLALKPAADAYEKIVPRPIRDGIGNGFDNLTYFNVVFNDFLQKKWKQGFGDFGRFSINSTIGVGGILDIATPWGLPAHENDFGVTLGKWGYGPGPYMVLPLLGPYDLRDVTGPIVETLATPLTWLNLPDDVGYPLGAVDTIQARLRSDYIFRFRNAAAVDPYVFTREAYLQYRQGKINAGTPAATQPSENLYDEDIDSGAPATQPATRLTTTRPGE